MIYNKTFLCSLIILAGLSADAQLYTQLTSEYAHINSVFTNPGYQSLTINYYYSTEKKPTVYTDSMNASFQVHQGNYFGRFGENSVMQNSQYLLSLYGSNGSILVSNPIRQKAAMMQGVNFDSAFLATNVDSAWITDLGSTRTIRYRFTDSSAFKTCTVSYDKNNYQLQKIAYCMKQRVLSPDDTLKLHDNPCISILYSGYSQAAFSDSIFDHNLYIVKDSTGQFKGVGTYSNYEVVSTYRDTSDTSSGGPLSMNSVPNKLHPSTARKRQSGNGWLLIYDTSSLYLPGLPGKQLFPARPVAAGISKRNRHDRYINS